MPFGYIPFDSLTWAYLYGWLVRFVKDDKKMFTVDAYFVATYRIVYSMSYFSLFLHKAIQCNHRLCESAVAHWHSSTLATRCYLNNKTSVV